MAIYKRGSIYWYKFTFNGEAIRESTRQKNQHTARQMEAAHRASLAKGEVGIRDRKPSPTLSGFCGERFEPWARSSFEASTPANWFWYRAVSGHYSHTSRWVTQSSTASGMSWMLNTPHIGSPMGSRSAP